MNQLNEKDLLEKFLLLEVEKGLFFKKILDVEFWHLIRFTIYNQIQKSSFNPGDAHTNLNKASSIKKFILKMRQLKYFIYKNPLLVFKKKDILILNHQRRVKEYNYYTCLYTDSLIEELRQSNIAIEEPMLEKHYRPTKHNNILYTDFINFIVAIKKRILRKKLSINDKIIVLDLSKYLNEAFDVDLMVEELEKMILNTVINFKYRINYYNRILKRLKPKVIIEVVSYSMSRYVVNHLAKELKIPTIELQHGTIGKYHVAYNFKEKINLKTFPDYIFTFGQFWKDNSRFPIVEENVKVVGWPYLENKVNFYKKTIKECGSKKTILFISQGTIGKLLSKVAIELSKLITEDYNIIYKLHPGEYDRWKTEYPWLIDTNIQVIDHNKNDIHYYFAETDVQVGVYSTALFEGLNYSLNSFILPFYGFSHMEKLIENGSVVVVSGSDDLYVKLKHLHSENSKNEYIWATGSIKKMKLYIESIMKDHLNDFKT